MGLKSEAVVKVPALGFGELQQDVLAKLVAIWILHRGSDFVEQGKAAVRRLKPGGEIGANVIVEQGLSGGEQIIVEGFQGVRAGMPVTATPMPVTLGRS